MADLLAAMAVPDRVQLYAMTNGKERKARVGDKPVWAATMPDKRDVLAWDSE